MLYVSSKAFHANQKKYLDLLDQKEEIIIQRGETKSYRLTAISDGDAYFADPELLVRIEEAQKQIEQGEGIRVKLADLDEFLGI